VVIGETQPEPAPVFISKCAETGSSLKFADQVFTVKKSIEDSGFSGVMKVSVYRGDDLMLPEIRVPLTGNYQLKNIATVCAACEELTRKGIPVSGREVQQGIEKVIRNTGLMGRWQILSKKPLTLCDTGHNEAGLKYVLEQIAETPHERLHFVFGMVNDKNIRPVLEMLPHDAIYYFCRADIPRALDVEVLGNAAKEVGLTGQNFATVASALEAAREKAEKNDLIFIGGSTFVVAEVV
jgi:dihydrofolate synthase / folylpolyglutamate synthase